jgi:hypothetical protein
LPAGSLIKFIITEAKNPQGSRPTGPWTVTTETPIDGVFYKVDGRTFPESFFAKSGQISSDIIVAQVGSGQNFGLNSNLPDTDVEVSSSETIYRFKLVCDHDIPSKGKLIVGFPEDTVLSQDIVVQGLSDVK